MDNKEISKWIKDEKIIKIPKKQKNKIELLEYIAELSFQKDISYTEKEINEILKKFYDDYVLLRRYMVDYKILFRKEDGSSYWY